MLCATSRLSSSAISRWTSGVYFFIYVCIGECVLEVDLVTKEPKCADKSHDDSEATIRTSCCI